MTADLVDVGNGTAESDYGGKDVRGNILLAAAQPGAVQELAVEKFGAAGIISYALNQPQAWRGDVVAVAKRALRSGEMLDGEGGYTVWGRLVPAERSLSHGALPIGLAHHVRLRRDIGAGEIVRWDDVEIEDSAAVRARREMERRFAPPSAPAMQQAAQ